MWVYEIDIVSSDGNLSNDGVDKVDNVRKCKATYPELCVREYYGVQTAKSIHENFKEVSADVQMFLDAHNHARDCNTARVKEAEVLLTFIAIHLGNRDKIY